MAGLKDAAIAAAKEQNAGYRQRRLEEREKTLTKIMEERWFDYGGWKGFDLIPEVPPRDAFTYMQNVEGGFSGGRLDGWRVEVDGVPVLFVITHGQQGLRVLLTCPECGTEHTESFHGLASLGEKLAKGRAMFHKCRQVEARELAYAIGRSAHDMKLPPWAAVQEAFDQHSDLIARYAGGR
jgi:hypothetical protein